MKRIVFEKTTEELGDMGSAHFSVGYVDDVGIDAWHRLLVTNGKAKHDFPDTMKTFVLKAQITGAENGDVELKMEIGRGAPRSIFKHTISQAEAFQTQVLYALVAP